MNLLLPDGCAQVDVHCIRHGGSAHPRRISLHKESPVERYYRDAQTAMVLFEGPTALRDELAGLLLAD